MAPVSLEVSCGDALPGRNWIDVDVLDSTGNPIDLIPPARIVTDGSAVPVNWANSSALPTDRDLRLRFGIHGAARLFGFNFRLADQKA